MNCRHVGNYLNCFLSGNQFISSKLWSWFKLDTQMGYLRSPGLTWTEDFLWTSGIYRFYVHVIWRYTRLETMYTAVGFLHQRHIINEGRSPPPPPHFFRRTGCPISLSYILTIFCKKKKPKNRRNMLLDQYENHNYILLKGGKLKKNLYSIVNASHLEHTCPCDCGLLELWEKTERRGGGEGGAKLVLIIQTWIHTIFVSTLKERFSINPRINNETAE